MRNKTPNSTLKDFILSESKNDNNESTTPFPMDNSGIAILPRQSASTSNTGIIALSKSSTALITKELALRGIVTIHGPSSKKDNFINGVNALIGEESTIDEISNTVNKPLPDETEDEFVKRAKSQISDVLFNLMSKK